ncbi:large ribosomal subunit protein eL29-like [Saccopteryx bilineata]|uniref:large ribosomal subunit protein eL29-like n=1 Tax=Saccopteryx bilineata TaxID=59482 RepID=UPI00338ED845
MQATNAKAMNVRTETSKALIKPNKVKPKIPKGGSFKLNRLAYIAHPKLGKYARAHTAKGLRLCQSKSKARAQTKPQAEASAQAPRGAQVPMKDLE